MPDFFGWIGLVGALCFGVVIGWVTSRTLRRAQPGGLTDIATVIGAVGGAAVVALFRRETGDFGAYCIGLMIGFFIYLIAAVKAVPVDQRSSVGDWLGSEPPRAGLYIGRNSYTRNPDPGGEYTGGGHSPDDVMPPP